MKIVQKSPLTFQGSLFLFLCLVAFPFFATAQLSVSLTTYANGFQKPVDIVSAGDDRLFIVQQNGTVRIIDADGTTLSTPFLQLNVNFGANEQGMLGMVFHPDYANNGYFYVNHTAGSGDGFSKIARYSVDPSDPNKADPNSEYVILTVTQPDWNHNAGDLVFGPDGYLYIGFGDGGSGGDPWGNGQNTSVMLGKMLRIDVDSEQEPYGIPASNPFLNDSDILDEIWAVGMRNPWRYSFDRMTGDMWIGDVGQNAKEEIDFIAAADVVNGGLNFGWDCREGDLAYDVNNCAPSDVLTEPVHVYKIGGNFSCNSVTGGYVYRGCEFPDIYGQYLYADYCNGKIWALSPDGNNAWVNTEVYSNSQIDISTFGEDNNGNLYVARHGNGTIYKITTDFELAPLVYDEPGDIITASPDFEAYQWYKNGNILNGETNSTLSNIEAGGSATYYCLYLFGDCTMTSEDIEVTIISSVNSIPGLTQFELSPNPFSEKLLLDVSLETQVDLSVEVLDINGEVLLSLKNDKAVAFRETLDLAHLSSGVYFVRIQTKEGKATRKVVKH